MAEHKKNDISSIKIQESRNVKKISQLISLKTHAVILFNSYSVQIPMTTLTKIFKISKIEESAQIAFVSIVITKNPISIPGIGKNINEATSEKDTVKFDNESEMEDPDLEENNIALYGDLFATEVAVPIPSMSKKMEQRQRETSGSSSKSIQFTTGSITIRSSAKPSECPATVNKKEGEDYARGESCASQGECMQVEEIPEDSSNLINELRLKIQQLEQLENKLADKIVQNTADRGQYRKFQIALLMNNSILIIIGFGIIIHLLLLIYYGVVTLVNTYVVFSIWIIILLFFLGIRGLVYADSGYLLQISENNLFLYILLAISFLNYISIEFPTLIGENLVEFLINHTYYHLMYCFLLFCETISLVLNNRIENFYNEYDSLNHLKENLLSCIIPE